MSSSGAQSELPSPQRLSLLLQIFAVHARMSELVERELRRDGVEVAGYALLSSIGAFGPIRLTEVASLLGVAMTTASDGVRRLEQRGLVERIPNPSDGRSTLLRLSAEGDAVWHAGWPALQRATLAIRDHLSAPEDDVRGALTSLEAALGEALTAT
jgi:DNA-binding MarR family transcriptional regulator